MAKEVEVIDNGKWVMVLAMATEVVARCKVEVVAQCKEVEAAANWVVEGANALL